MEAFIAIVTALSIIAILPITYLSLMFGSDDDGYTILEKDAHLFD